MKIEGSVVLVYDRNSFETKDGRKCNVVTCLAQDESFGRLVIVSKNLFCSPDVYAQVTEQGYYEVNCTVSGKAIGFKLLKGVAL